MKKRKFQLKTPLYEVERVVQRSDDRVSRLSMPQVDSPPAPLSAMKRGGVKEKISTKKSSFKPSLRSREGGPAKR